MVEKNRIQIFSADGARPVFNQFADRDFILCVVVHHGFPSRSRGTCGWPACCPSADAPQTGGRRLIQEEVITTCSESADSQAQGGTSVQTWPFHRCHRAG